MPGNFDTGRRLELARVDAMHPNAIFEVDPVVAASTRQDMNLVPQSAQRHSELVDVTANPADASWGICFAQQNITALPARLKPRQKRCHLRYAFDSVTTRNPANIRQTALQAFPHGTINLFLKALDIIRAQLLFADRPFHGSAKFFDGIEHDLDNLVDSGVVARVLQ